ncbi:hypothetical protein ABBQ32_008044 [Trebouxia sp. C0010 RCD-2024]
MLQDEADADLDLDAINELLSQHSNQKSHAHPASQAGCCALVVGGRANTGVPSSNNLDPSQLEGVREYKFLAPAGPDTSDVIDLACVPDPTPSSSSPHRDSSVHPGATYTSAEVLPPSPACRKQAHGASTDHRTSNRGGLASTSSQHSPAAPRGPWCQAVKVPSSQDPQAVVLNIKEFDLGCFAVSSVYHAPLVALYKQLSSRPTWHSDQKLWSFRNEAYEELMNRLMAADFAVRVIPLGQDIASAALGADDAALAAALKCPAPAVISVEEVDSLLHRNIPDSVFSRLYPFQKEGVRFGVKHQGRVLLADEMGLGKTVQAICIAACYPENWPLLVICPSSMRLVWYDALLNWLPARLVPEDPRHLTVIANGKDIKTKLLSQGKPSRQQIVIISYDLVQKMQDYVNHFGVVVCDESHALKTHSAKRTQFIWPLVQKAKRAILITGTPALSRPIELFPQIDMLVPGLLGKRDEYGQRYCGGKPMFIARGMYDWRSSSNLAELNAVLQKHLLIRRLKKNVLQDLPAKLRQRVPIEVDYECVGLLEGIKAEIAAVKADPNLSEEEKQERAKNKMQALYAASGCAKVKGALEQVERALQEGEKVIVFAHHKVVLDGLQAKLGKACQAVRIDGSTSMEARKQAMDTFQQRPQPRLAILSITAAGIGITLTAAQCVIFAELYWNPGHLVQAEDRAHRLGQKGCVQVRYLIAPGTIDDAMWPLLGRKLQVVGKALDGHATGSATGLQITDASSFADYVPIDAAHTSTPTTTLPALADPSLPLSPQQAVNAHASSRSPLPNPQQQPAGGSHIPFGTPGQGVLPDTGFREGSVYMQHGAVTGQGARLSGQQVSIKASPAPVTGQKLPIGALSAPFSGQKGPVSGQKRPTTGPNGPSASKHSRQTTLDATLKGRDTISGGSAKRRSTGSSGELPSGSGMVPLHWSKGVQTPCGEGSVQHARQYKAAALPGAGVAQVLDLTQADEGMATRTGTGTKEHGGSPWLQPPAGQSTGCVNNRRRETLLRPDSSARPAETAHVVDLT